nr:hypothetical protein [Tanacetum cinerariifolium]
MLPVAPPSPDYVLGPEEPQTPPAPHDEDEHEPMFIQPHDPDFVPEPIYHEYIPLEDKYVLSAEEQPLPPVVSPTAESPEYVVELDQEEDPEEYEDDKTEDDEDEEDEEEEEEEEEHLAPANSAIVMPTVELASPPEGTELVIPPPFTETTTTGAKRERLARCMTPAACPSPPPAPSLLLPSSRCLTQIQTLRDDIPETEMPPRKRLCLSTLGFSYEVGESFTARPTGGREIDYGFVSTLDAKARRRGIGEVGVTELVELHEHDTHDLYVLLEDAQDSRTRISQRVVVDSQLVNLLIKDRIAHQDTIQIVEEKAYAAREASCTDGRDSPSDGRYKMRDGRHAGRVASTIRAAKES